MRLPGVLSRHRLATRITVGVVLVAVWVGLAIGLRSVVDQESYVSELRLDAAMQTFRPEPHPGLAKPLAETAFDATHNPDTDPSRCSALTALATTGALDGRSWTGAGDGPPAAPVTVLTVRFADAAAARHELDRKRRAILTCHRIAVVFPPFDAPAVDYTVSGALRPTTIAGSTLRWRLAGDGRRFDFYVVRYGNTLSWTYDDDTLSSPRVREQVADDLVGALRDITRD